MRCSRFLAVLAAATLVVVCSGCGSEEKKDFSSAGSSRQAISANGGAIDASLITPDHFAAIVINVRRIAQSPLLAELLKDEKVVGAIKSFGIDPSEIEQIVVPIGLDEKQPAQPKPISFMITRFVHDVDAKEVLNRLHPKAPIEEVQLGGKTCLDLRADDGGLAYVSSKNTIVLASPENMGRVLAVTEPNGPLYERLKNASTDKDLLVVLVSERHPGLDKQIDVVETGGPPVLRDYLEVVKTLREGTIALDLKGDTLLQIVLDAKDATAANAAEVLFKDNKKMLSGLLAAARQNASKEFKTKYADAFNLGDEAIDSIHVAKSDTQVTVMMKRPVSLDKAGPLVKKAIQAYRFLSMDDGHPKPEQAPTEANQSIPGQPRK